MIKPFPKEWREERLAEHRAELREGLAQRPERDRRNIPLALSLARLDVLTYRGVTYDVRFLPYADGLELSTLQWELGQLSRRATEREQENVARRERGEPVHEEDAEVALRALLGIMKRAADLFARQVSLPSAAPPRGFWRMWWTRMRASWALARLGEPPPTNPFLTMTQAESFDLFDFFSECRMRSGVHPATKETHLRLT